MRLAVFGGSFDPIHEGHVSILEAASRELRPDRLILMPAHVSPFKQDSQTAPDRDRLAMARLAAAEVPGCEVSSWEIDRGTVSYTWDTLTAIRQSHPEADIWFLTGADSFLELETWYRGPELLSGFRFALCLRPGYDSSICQAKMQTYEIKYSARVRILSGRQVPVSSTEIRERIREGKPLSGLVPAAVETYIHEHRLYRTLPEEPSL